MDWERWCDDFFSEEARYPFWHELITAVQADACGTSNGQKASGFEEGRISGVTGSAVSLQSDQSRYRQLGMSCGDADASCVEGTPTSSPAISEAGTQKHAAASIVAAGERG